MVARDLNHPSVFMWSIGNEIPQAADQSVVNELMGAIKAKDTTRPIGQAFAAWAFDEGSAGLEDYVGINYAPDRYDSVHAAHPSWKIIASESSSALRSRGIYDNNNTQCSSYDDFAAGWGATAEQSWQDVNTRDWVAGETLPSAVRARLRAWTTEIRSATSPTRARRGLHSAARRWSSFSPRPLPERLH
jgi:beta-galactosidase